MVTRDMRRFAVSRDAATQCMTAAPQVGLLAAQTRENLVRLLQRFL